MLRKLGLLIKQNSELDYKLVGYHNYTVRVFFSYSAL
jgi:hypothetical protein